MTLSLKNIKKFWVEQLSTRLSANSATITSVTTLIYGDDPTAVSTQLTQLIVKAKAKDLTVIRVNADSLTLPDLELTLTAQELFETERLVIIEGVHGLPVGKRRSSLISRLAEFQSLATQLIMAENKVLTPTQLKVFSQAKLISCKLPKTVFTWLDRLGSSNEPEKQLELLNQAVHDASAEQVFYLLIRHIRTLIIVADGGMNEMTNSELPAFTRNKVLAQARKIGFDRLTEIYKKLVEIDVNLKTGQSLLTMEQHLQQLVLADV